MKKANKKPEAAKKPAIKSREPRAVTVVAKTATDANRDEMARRESAGEPTGL